MKVMLYKETVSNEMWELLQMLMKDEKLKDFFLVGGTALSLRLGHRLSIDIDLFTTNDFDSKVLLNYLSNNYGAKEAESKLSKNTVLTYIEDIKVDIVCHKYPLLNQLEEKEGVRMISNEDIGAMKLHAIHQSGKRYKDFIDMYFLLESHPLKVYLEAYQKKYNKDSYWASVGLNTYDKIETFLGVDLIKEKQMDWKQVKKRLEEATKNPTKKFISERKTEPINIKKNRGFRR